MSDEDVPTLTVPQLEQYLARVRYTGPRPLVPSLPVLVALHRAQAFAVPFESLNMFVPHTLGGFRVGGVGTTEYVAVHRPFEEHFRRLVVQRRGGGCLPQNQVFAAVLKTVGFAGVETWAAITQVEQKLKGYRPGEALPHEGHLLVAVLCDCRRYLCDLGNPVEGLMQPVRIQLDAVQPVDRHNAFALRIFPENAAYLELRLLRDGKWTRCLAFRPIARPIAYVAAEVETQARKELAALGSTLFKDHLVIARQRPDGVDTLLDMKLRRRTWQDNAATATTTTTQITSNAQFQRVLKEVFDLDVPITHMSVSLEPYFGVDARL